MSEHLPECPCTAIGVPSCICDDDEECGPHCRHHCICDRLRAALAAQATAHEAALAAAYTLMGASIQSAIEAEQAEHEAALAEMERRTREDDNRALWDNRQYDKGVSDERARWEAGGPWFRVSKVEAYERGVAHATARIRAGVKALSHDRLTWKAAVLAIIDGEAS